MTFFAYAMLGLLVLIWVILLVKLISIVSRGKQAKDKEGGQD
jgi:hypothetical protein